MLKTFSPSLLRQWVFNFTGNSTLPFVTTSALIELAELEAFIIAIKKQQADSVRVYFLRFGPDDAPTDKSGVNGHLAEGCKWNMASSGLTQATMALVPAKNFRHDADFICSADDIVTGEGMLTLYPGTIAVGTNLNPPGGNGSSLDTTPVMDGRQFISSLPTFVVGIAAGVSLVSFVYHYPAPLKKLSLLWVLNFCVDIAGLITKNMGIKNHWLYNIYFWIMYLVLAYLYGTQIQNKKVRLSIRWFYVLFPVLVIVQTITSGIQDLQPMVIVGGDVFMIFLVAAYFRQLYLSEETESITRDPWFWFSFGFLIHFGGTVPFLGMLNFLWQHYKTFTSFYYVYVSNSFTILLNLLIITGFLCWRNYQRSR